MDLEKVLYAVVACLLSGGIGFLFFRKKETPPADTKEINSKIKKTDDSVSSAPTETGATLPVEQRIEGLKGDKEKVLVAISEKEESLANTEKEETGAPLNTPEKAADWVNALGKKEDPK